MSDFTIASTCLDNLERHDRLPGGAIRTIRQLVESARVVRVLDEWEERDSDRRTELNRAENGFYFCFFGFAGKERGVDELHNVFGPTRAQARAAAVAAIEKGEV